MGLFQNSVLRNHLKNIDNSMVSTAFETYQKELLEMQAQINITDKQIDEMVYALHGLSEDEIKVINEQ